MAAWEVIQSSMILVLRHAFGTGSNWIYYLKMFIHKYFDHMNN